MGKSLPEMNSATLKTYETIPIECEHFETPPPAQVLQFWSYSRTSIEIKLCNLETTLAGIPIWRYELLKALNIVMEN